ncbi:MAG: hypothetical protein AAF587_44455 [Bacteroidota bacterium]
MLVTFKTVSCHHQDIWNISPQHHLHGSLEDFPPERQLKSPAVCQLPDAKVIHGPDFPPETAQVACFQLTSRR